MMKPTAGLSPGMPVGTHAPSFGWMDTHRPVGPALADARPSFVRRPGRGRVSRASGCWPLWKPAPDAFAHGEGVGAYLPP